MPNKTNIEWTDLSSSLIKWREKSTGKTVWHCAMLSPGCSHCYAAALARRFHSGGDFTGLDDHLYEPYFDAEEAAKLIRRKDSARVFVCDMTDVFHGAIPDAMIDLVFTVAALCPSLTFQLLTKRARRMHEYMTERRDEGWTDGYVRLIAERAGRVFPSIWKPGFFPYERNVTDFQWPLPNVWLGVSTEDQRRWDERVPHLLRTPAAVRFVSAEPLLGQIRMCDVSGWSGPDKADWWGKPILGADRIGWVISGGESGPKARPMHPDWPRSLRDECVAANVPFFFKQHGEFVSVSEVEGPGRHHRFDDGATVRRVGKKAAGRLLYENHCGREWSEFPSQKFAQV